MTDLDQQLRRVVALHFNPDSGAPFWLEQRSRLDFDPLTELRSVHDLRRFGPMPLDALATRPVEDFVPRRLHPRLPECITSETGGTTGPPKRTVFFPDEFEAAFVTPFVQAAKLAQFPKALHWLFIGPTGPHIIGKAARACAHALGSMDPFTVDFDPRWVRKLLPESMARRRYLEHVVEQAEAVLASQRIGVLFSTPPVLEALGVRLPVPVRERIAGIHLGGLPSTPDFLQQLRENWFPRAQVLGGYGNSLAGVCPELEPTPGAPPRYFPHGARLILEIDRPDGAERGALRFHRLDASMFLPNVIERDEAAPAAPPEEAQNAGFVLPGIVDPRPAAALPTAASGGLY